MYPLPDPRGKGPLICLVNAFRGFSNKSDNNDEFLKCAPERTDHVPDRAYYFSRALESIKDTDEELRTKLFANIKRP